MRNKTENQRGVTIIAAIFIITILAFVGVMFLTIFTTSSTSSLNDFGSAQALSVAEGGLAHALYQLKAGTTCTALAFNNVSLNPGTFTTSGTRYNPASTTLSGPITNAATTIPVISTAGYAPQGRIRIESEEINYTAIAGNTFTGARRGVAGTSAAAHAVGRPVPQDQCRVQSTGTVGNAARAATADAPGNPAGHSVASLDAPSTAVGTAETNIAGLGTSLNAGDNLIIVVVSLQNTGASRDIAAGDLRLKKGAVVLASNQSLIRVGGGAAPSGTVFPRETQFLLYKDAGAGANPIYDVTALASGAGVSAEVKMAVLNSVPASSFQDGGSVAVGTTETTILSHASTVLAGNNVILAAIQLDNTAGGTRSYNPGNLRLKKGAAVLASNEFTINLDRQNQVNRGTGVLLMARDPGAAANPTYAVTGIATNTNSDAEAKIIVLNGLSNAFFDSTSVAVGTTESVMGSLPTTFPAGENVIIANSQYDNSAGAQRNIVAGNERISFGGAPEASNQFDIMLCTTGTVECDDFTSGLLSLHTGAPANPTYDVRALASAAGINAETKIMAIHIDITVPIFGQR